MAVDLTELQAELLNDPNGYGYAPLISAGNLVGVAALLNQPRPEIQIMKQIISQAEIQAALVQSEYVALAPVRQQLWNAYTCANLDMTVAPGMRTQIEGLFNSTGATYTALQGVWGADGSRGQQLWQSYVSWQDCAAALALPPPSLTGVPATYTPDLTLPWAVKATHIWAVHPSDPLKADKGGLTLELVTGTMPVPSVFSDNTMEFHGGTEANASYYRTVASMLFGLNIAPPDNPPTWGSIAFWVYESSRAGYVRYVGSDTVYYSPAVSGHNAGYLIPDIGEPIIYAGLPAPGTWMHIVASNDSNENDRTYINGVKVDDQYVPSYGGYARPFCIGSAGRDQLALEGRIRLVAVINGGVWTDAEILDMYQNPFAYYEG